MEKVSDRSTSEQASKTNPAPSSILQGPTVSLISEISAATTACHELSEQPCLYASAAPALSCASRRKEDDHAPQNYRLLLVAGPDARVFAFDLEHLGGAPDCLVRILGGAKSVIGFDVLSTAPELWRQLRVVLGRPVDLQAAWILADGYSGPRHDARTLAAAVECLLGECLPDDGLLDWRSLVIDREELGRVAQRTAVLPRLHSALAERVSAAGVERAWDLENSVISPLAVSTIWGMRVDTTAVQSLISDGVGRASAAKAQVVAALGDINPAAAAQVRAAVSTRYHVELRDFSFSTLAECATTIPALTQVIAYRRATSTISVASSWLEALGPDGRVHPRFHPLAAVTGRMSCSNPALQQVPRALEVRSCFVPAVGYKYVVADYSMCQLRIAAELTHDPEMIRCFRSEPEIDLHKRTASAVLGVPIEAVTEEQRTKAKVFNFGLLLGMTPRGLVFYAKDVYGLTLTLAEATAARSRFFELYPGLAQMHATAQVQAPKARMARTMSGRLRHLTDPRKLVGHYLCTPVQGTEADIFKRAIALMYPRLAEIGACIVNVIHDEFVVEAPASVAEQARTIVVWAMSAAMSEFLKLVPVGTIKATIQDSWGKA